MGSGMKPCLLPVLPVSLIVGPWMTDTIVVMSGNFDGAVM